MEELETAPSDGELPIEIVFQMMVMDVSRLESTKFSVFCPDDGACAGS
jgi:hypothetical protein